MGDDSSGVQKKSDSTYTAVLYFHGMGNQRRYEEVSRLVDALDKYAHHTLGKGILTKIHARLEPPRGPMERDASYIRVVHGNAQEKVDSGGTAYRFYEYYWASITAGGRPVVDVLKWLFRRAFIPFQTVRSPWRERQRLRRAALQRLCQKCSLRKGGAVDRGDLLKVLLAYNDFEGPDARRSYPKGKFREFVNFVEEEFKKRPETKERLVRLVRQWRAFYIKTEFLTTATLMTLFLSLLLGVAALGGLAYILLAWANVIGSDLSSVPFVSSLSDALVPDIKNTVSLLLLLASVLGIAGFLRDYLGDVQLWTTYEETDEKYAKRKEILEKACQVLMHVLEDANCERVVVVGHSLGTAIAFDTLLEAGRYNRARNTSDPMKGPLSLEKIDHFITLGSPIDKVHYFFESHRGKYHRYNRVVEEVRGDIAAAPFARNGKPHMHWMNFWDQGDIVSGSLETPCNNRWIDLHVDNVHVTNRLFPSPGACHSAYFENRTVIEKVFDVIFENKYSFHDAPLNPEGGKDYESLLVGPGSFSAIAPIFQTIVSFLPWLIVVAMGLHAAGAGEGARSAVQWLIYLIVAAGAGLWAVSKARGPLHPIEKKDQR